MRTLPLSSSAAHTPSGEFATCTGAAAGGATGAGIATTAAGGIGGNGAGVVAASCSGCGAGGIGAAYAAGAVVATGAGAATTGAATTGAGAAGAGATSSPSSFFEPKPLRLNFEVLTPVIFRQSSDEQFFGASMWIFCPSITNEMPLPAWAAVLAINSAAVK